MTGTFIFVLICLWCIADDAMDFLIYALLFCVVVAGGLTYMGADQDRAQVLEMFPFLKSDE